MVVKSKLSRNGPSLEFMNYYRHFIKGYGKVTCPLCYQISGDNATHKKNKTQWTKECQETFDMLKVMCTSPLILAFADFTKPLKLHMDAHSTGLDAIL